MAKYIVSRTDGTPVPIDEPYFVVRATDIFAAAMIRYYMDLTTKMNLPYEMTKELMAHLNRLSDWQDNNRDKVKIPD